ncbi:MAG TPA: MauE/DoxX family redox-associated membrane protein [Terriglobales bacterium]|nr:MauE/DoxX family redox-associated membrane protein [Terriglobales bacterium]
MGVLASPLLRRGAQIVLGLLFLTASLAKIVDVASLAREVHNFHLAPLWSEHLLAMVLPWIELLAGLALVLGIRPRAGAWVAGVLLVVFTIAVASAMARGLNFHCGCFGTADSARIGWAKLGENVGMIVLAAIGSLKPR